MTRGRFEGSITINNDTPHLKSPKHQNRRAALGRPAIEIDLNGILKLLANLKPDKAAGPDEIKPILLKELRSEIAPVFKPIFKKSLE